MGARDRIRRGILGPVAQCRGRRGAGDGDEDLHPRGHGGDDATCLWTRPSYHRDRPRPSRAAPARRFVRPVVLLTQPRVCAWAGRRSRPFALSIPRVLLAEDRRGHGNATAVRSQSEPVADEDRRAANEASCHQHPSCHELCELLHTRISVSRHGQRYSKCIWIDVITIQRAFYVVRSVYESVLGSP